MTGGDVYLGVIEMYSEAWPDRIVLVADFVGHTVITEDGITLNALPSGLAVSLPKRDATGAQNLTFALDGVRPEATPFAGITTLRVRVKVHIPPDIFNSEGAAFVPHIHN